MLELNKDLGPTPATFGFGAYAFEGAFWAPSAGTLATGLAGMSAIDDLVGDGPMVKVVGVVKQSLGGSVLLGGRAVTAGTEQAVPNSTGVAPSRLDAPADAGDSHHHTYDGSLAVSAHWNRALPLGRRPRIIACCSVV